MFLALSSLYLVLDYLFFSVGSGTCADDSRGKERVVRAIVSFFQKNHIPYFVCKAHKKSKWNSKKFLKSRLFIRKK